MALYDWLLNASVIRAFFPYTKRANFNRNTVKISNFTQETLKIKPRNLKP